jgi:uncharacterized protein (TIGR01319 family)
MSAGARVLEVLSRDDELEYRLEVLKEIKPDIILLAGGTDDGDAESAVENAKIIVSAALQSVVIVACNRMSRFNVCTILSQAEMRFVEVANVMPTIHELNVRPARTAIHAEFIKQITAAKGLGEIQETLTDKEVMPTPGAVLLATELLARGTYKQDGVGSVLVMDIGGATTDVHSVIPELDKLKPEERGLVINNEKQVSLRTVEGNLGLRVSATGICEAVGAELLAARTGDLSLEMQNKIIEYTRWLETNPSYIAKGSAERCIDTAMAITALELALKRHAGQLSQRYDQTMGIVPGYPMGRDLRTIQNVIFIGGIFTHSNVRDREYIARQAFANPGFYLLPESPTFFTDDEYLLYALGLLSRYIPDETLSFAKDYFNFK